ncbi:putative leucine-rich repeat receptor-like serine/threonine-protein kinase [Cucumis melo var. makuwa]|uniref:Putative leucine-rich repeat receptor-like serine/threonine-protein kinase n=1 Tax=Cucumis melo var. makuwa TaxID=1194695 RepID=A0A5D3DZ64_CUCMM|nr:putative leucine-rich repeat receptor-like serine/threonine-protein kinase [Cucumis melo var. makuwa]
MKTDVKASRAVIERQPQRTRVGSPQPEPRRGRDKNKGKLASDQNNGFDLKLGWVVTNLYRHASSTGLGQPIFVSATHLKSRRSLCHHSLRHARPTFCPTSVVHRRREMGINLRKGSFPSHKDSFPYDSSPSIYFFFHLAENEMLSSGTVREISIVLNDIYSIVPSVILQYLVPRTICTTSVGILVNLNEENYLQIFGASWDPCFPEFSIWSGLNFSHSNPPRIISLDLSHNNLSGLLPEFLAQLPLLKILDLTGNNLSGTVFLCIGAQNKLCILCIGAHFRPTRMII